MRRRRRTYCEAVKAATLSFKSRQVVEKVRRELRDEGLTEGDIEETLAHVRVLPDLEDEHFPQ